MSSPEDRPSRSRRSVVRDVGALLLLALLVFTLHWRSLHYGLFMDDHVHCRQLRACGWSLGELTDACRLELVGGPLDAWFMPDCTLRFFRPLAFGLMKLTYTLTGWRPARHARRLARLAPAGLRAAHAPAAQAGRNAVAFLGHSGSVRSPPRTRRHC